MPLPELPDVEVFRRYLEGSALDQTVAAVEVRADIVRGLPAARFRARLKGRRFLSTARHGKYLFVKLDDGSWLVLHFGMTGYLQYARTDEPPPEHTRVLFTFSNGHRLAFVLQRKLGRAAITDNIESFIKEQGLGPDVLGGGFDLRAFRQALGRRGSIKSALMNQKRMAGIGNIYADEILFRAKLHPAAKMGNLDDEQLGAVFHVVKEVLRAAIDAGADPARMPEDFLLPHREEGARCPACGGQIARTKISGRTAYFCPKCQKE